MPSPPPACRTWILALLAGALLAGCSTATAPEPPVADSTLVAVLADLHLADARAERLGDLPPGIRDSILAYHGLTEQQFQAGIDYYVERPDAYLELYNSVIDHLSEESQKIYQLYYEKPEAEE